MTKREAEAMNALCDAIVKLTGEIVGMSMGKFGPKFPEEGLMLSPELSVADCRAMAVVTETP